MDTDYGKISMPSHTNSPLIRLSGKEFSPLVIRRYSTPFLHWVAVITDDDLSDLDGLVQSVWKANGPPDKPNIQDLRNFAGHLSEALYAHYSRLEGAAVILSADKLLISSLFGDFMVHTQCRLELYSLLNLSTNV